MHLILHEWLALAMKLGELLHQNEDGPTSLLGSMRNQLGGYDTETASLRTGPPDDGKVVFPNRLDVSNEGAADLESGAFETNMLHYPLKRGKRRLCPFSP